MIATIDIADLGATRTLRTLIRRPPRDVPGLRWAQTALLTPLASRRPPSLRRTALIALWDDETAAEQFRADHLAGRRFAHGFHATLRPLRAFGTWPGLPADLPSSRSVDYEGPVVVITLGRLRPSQLIRFL
ncbi:MAG: spheroidene monooxygenase, partial [Actinobacteria bacterium]|nr:spheroidene monooxygenase [Actinomycetota bacterium]